VLYNNFELFRGLFDVDYNCREISLNVNYDNMFHLLQCIYSQKIIDIKEYPKLLSYLGYDISKYQNDIKAIMFSNDVEQIKKILNLHTYNFNLCKDILGKNVYILHYHLFNNNLDIVRLLIDKCDVNYQDFYGNTLAHIILNQMQNKMQNKHCKKEMTDLFECVMKKTNKMIENKFQNTVFDMIKC